jgi:N-hydroxyarylamine O-acetyltransferase
VTDAVLDLDAYLRRIAFDGPVAPTLATLARLIERHAAAIAFENIDVLAGRVPRLDLASLQSKLVHGRRGGYCFEQNGLFGAVLRQAGFVVAALEGRVRAGVPDDVATPRTHMALRVTLEGVDYLADVGFGGLAPTRPLAWLDRGVQHDGVGSYRLRDVAADVVLQCQTGDGWIDCYRLVPTEPQPIDHEMGNWFVATNPNAILRKNLLVGRTARGGRLTLFNRQLSLRRGAPAEVEETTLTTRAEIGDVFADGFDLQVEGADLDAVMAVIERHGDA